MPYAWIESHIADVVDALDTRLRRTGDSGPQYIMYAHGGIDHRGGVCVVPNSEIRPLQTAGWELATGEGFRMGFKTKAQNLATVREIARRLPILDGSETA